MRDIECGFADADGLPGYQHLIIYGPVIGVQIGYDNTYDPKILGTIPKINQEQYVALIDTGATTSSIDRNLADKLGLQIIDRGPLMVGSGVQEFNLYLAQVYIPRLNHTIYGEFHGVHLSDENGNGLYKAILGRNFLAHFKMVYEGWTGSVKLTSRLVIPS
ncbi:MAG: retropepsin-like aspartic protease [Bacteroidetes bacterium]|nr:retropepsin-like aspartic protease [Bacteroidota bacterium]